MRAVNLTAKRIITGQCRGREGPRRALESSILFSFETDFTGRVKAGPQIETWQGRSAAAFTPAVILFIALPEAMVGGEDGAALMRAVVEAA